jgi:hypothetical protein
VFPGLWLQPSYLLETWCALHCFEIVLIAVIDNVTEAGVPCLPRASELFVM